MKIVKKGLIKYTLGYNKVGYYAFAKLRRYIGPIPIPFFLDELLVASHYESHIGTLYYLSRAGFKNFNTVEDAKVAVIEAIERFKKETDKITIASIEVISA